MPRAPRPTAAGVYHLATRSTTPDRLFADGVDRLALVSQIERVSLDTDWSCLAACLMGTHYHLIVEAAEGVVGGAMKRINWAYAVRHNTRHGRRGHRVGSKYLCVPVLSDEQLLTCYRYLMHNPVEAGLCARPETWPWSSYASTVGLSSGFRFVDASRVLSLFHEDTAVAIERLRGFVEPPLTRETRSASMS
jgi:putative transposase